MKTSTNQQKQIENNLKLTNVTLTSAITNQQNQLENRLKGININKKSIRYKLDQIK